MREQDLRRERRFAFEVRERRRERYGGKDEAEEDELHARKITILEPPGPDKDLQFGFPGIQSRVN